MDSVSKQSLLFCPRARFINKEVEFRSIQFGESPILFNAEDDKSSSSSSSHTRPLDWCDNKDINANPRCFVCLDTFDGTLFYSCKVCEDKIHHYHKECIEPISEHPYHPKHSLRLKLDNWHTICICCSESSQWVYSCSICDFNMCQGCIRFPKFLEINHQKRHEHTLLYHPRKGSLICDVCGLIDSSLMYSCLRCDFVVHKKCVYMPWIIKISRHEHRLAYNSSLTPEKWFCGVCRGKIDTNYGRYSCVKGCSYGVHSKCATREDVWDGKELEGEPEDAYKEDLKSFIEISDGIIQHFSHPNHHMRLDEETDREFDDNKRCQACTLFICDDNIYNCMQCDFILHQECAHLPRKKQHPTHRHPLTLQADYHGGCFECTACERISNGFAYVCDEKKCDYELDISCVSIAEPLDLRCHPHSLFLTSNLQTDQTCSMCQRIRSHCLNCGECGFVLCFECATLPNKLRYKHDEHWLMLAYDKDASGEYLCEVSEKEAYTKNGIYMCSDCNIAVHIECQLGEDMRMLPGRVLESDDVKVDILHNNRLTRNICGRCNNRCQGKIVYKISDKETLCSITCRLEELFYHTKR